MISQQPKERLTLSLFVVVVIQSLSCAQLFVTPRTVAQQVPLSMRLSRQAYWSRLPFSSPGNLPRPGIKAMSPALANRFFTAEGLFHCARPKFMRLAWMGHPLLVYPVTRIMMQKALCKVAARASSMWPCTVDWQRRVLHTERNWAVNNHHWVVRCGMREMCSMHFWSWGKKWESHIKPVQWPEWEQWLENLSKYVTGGLQK